MDGLFDREIDFSICPYWNGKISSKRVVGLGGQDEIIDIIGYFYLYLLFYWSISTDYRLFCRRIALACVHTYGH